MRRKYFLLWPLLFLAALVLVMPATATAYLLDADSLTVGTYSSSSPLDIWTPYGNVSFIGEIRDFDNDPEFTAAGASGNVFDVAGTPSEATLTFTFDICSATFIYGGNMGVFDIEARDIAGNVVDSFFQASTYGGQPAGPITLAGTGIRTLFWTDPGYTFSAIDNLNFETAVPEPSTMLLLGLGLVGLAGLRRKD